MIESDRVAPDMSRSFAALSDPLAVLTHIGYYAHLIAVAERDGKPGLADMYRSYQRTGLRRYAYLRQSS